MLEYIYQFPGFPSSEFVLNGGLYIFLNSDSLYSLIHYVEFSVFRPHAASCAKLALDPAALDMTVFDHMKGFS